MAKHIESQRNLPGEVTVTFYIVGGTVAEPWFTIEVTRRGTTVAQFAKIRGRSKAASKFQSVLNSAANGKYAK